uniref:Uncharacterized protein n=1 Tax=Myotis lucifugus TaxID=59463 RepID=G1Q8K3_MYOLU
MLDVCTKKRLNHQLISALHHLPFLQEPGNAIYLLSHLNSHLPLEWHLLYFILL